MRKDVLYQLIKINLASSLRFTQNKVLTSKEIEKKARKSLRNTIFSYVGMGVLYAVIFGFIMVVVPDENIDSTLQSILFLLSVLALLMSTSTIFTTFYESKDVTWYRPFPVKESELLIGKGVAVILSIGVYILPLYTLLVIAFVRFQRFLLIGLIASIPLTAMLVLGFSSIAFIIVSYVARTRWFGSFQKLFVAMIMILNFLVIYVGIYFLQWLATYNIQIDAVLFRFFVLAVKNPFSIEFLLHFIYWMIGVGILFGIIYKNTIPRFYTDVFKFTTLRPSATATKTQQNVSLTKSLLRYNFGLLKNSSSVLYMTFFASIFPVVIMGRGSLSVLKQETITPSIIFPAMVIGIGLALLTTHQGSLPSIMLSLDGDNYDYLQTLPFSMKHYIAVKFYFTVVIHSALSIVFLTILQIWLEFPWYAYLCCYVGFILTVLLCSMALFCWDFKNLHTNWTNVNDLVDQRGKRGLGCVTSLLYFLIVICFFASFVFSHMMSFAFAVIVVGGLFVLLLGLTYYYYHSRFLLLLEGRLSKK